MKLSVHAIPLQSRPLRGAPASPRGKPRGPLRIRLGAFRLVFCVPQTPPPRLRAALLPFQGRLNSAPRWGSCRALARLRGCCSMNGNNSKSPTTPPLPLRGTSPKGGSKRPLRIRLGAFQMVFCVPPETPPARCALLSFALSSCTPFYEWLHLLNLSGEVFILCSNGRRRRAARCRGPVGAGRR